MTQTKRSDLESTRRPFKFALCAVCTARYIEVAMGDSLQKLGARAIKPFLAYVSSTSTV